MQTVHRLDVVLSSRSTLPPALLQFRHALIPLLHHFLIVRHVLRLTPSSLTHASMRLQSLQRLLQRAANPIALLRFYSPLLSTSYPPPNAPSASLLPRGAAEYRSLNTSKPRFSRSPPSDRSLRPSPYPSSTTSDHRSASCGIAVSRVAAAWSA